MVEVEHAKVSIGKCAKVVERWKGKVLWFVLYFYYRRVIIEIKQYNEIKG